MNRHAASILLVLGGVVWVYGGVLSSLARQWASDDNYSHGFLIIPLALYCAWERRDALARAEIRPHLAGLALIVFSLLIFAAGVLAAELFLTRMSLVGVVIGTVLWVWGPAYVRQLAFPLGILPLMIPLPAVVFNQIAFPLQLLASRVGEATVSAAGIPVLREGNVLELPNTTLAVAEACSGIRSLVSLITLAVVLAYFTERMLITRTLIVLAALPIAIAANAARVAGTGLAAFWIGPAAAEGFFHAFSGWLMFGVAFAALFAVQRALRLIPALGWHRRRLTQEERCSPAR